MKRSFSQIDEYLPSNIDEVCHMPVKATLNRISALERNIDNKIDEYCRLNYIFETSPSIQTKILRNFIRHEYTSNPNNVHDQGYFTIFVEGHLLDQYLIQARMDDKLGNSIKYGTFWEKIRVQIDRQGHGMTSNQSMVYEWKYTDNNHGGMLADCFRFRIPNIWFHKSSLDGKLPIKITYHRSSDVLPRYELSPILKNILPNMRADPTETEAMTAIWEYARLNDLLEKRYVRVNEELRPVFGSDSILISQVRSKVMDHLLPAKPIEVEYVLTMTGSNIPVNAKHTPLSYTKYGAMAFDIEVEIEDQISWKIVSKMNNLQKHKTMLEHELDSKYRQCSYIMKSIRKAATQPQYSSIKNDDLLTYPNGLFTLEDPIFAIQNRKAVLYGNENASLSEGRLAIKQQVQHEWTLLKEGRQFADSNFRQLNQIPSFAEMKTDSQQQGEHQSLQDVEHDVEEEKISLTPMQLSVTHTSRGFLDVGDDDLFRSPWVMEVAKQLLQQQPST